MKKYKYKTIVISKLTGSRTDDEHRKIIDEYAAKGYQYVGYIPTNMTRYGQILSMDLIFEIDE